MTRQKKTEQQRAEQALGVAERRWERLNQQVNKARDDLRALEGEWVQAKNRLEYARKDPALQGSSRTTGTTDPSGDTA
jgi:chromosome segregation ATPase